MIPGTVRVLIVGQDEEGCWLLRLALQQDARLLVGGHAKSGRELTTLLVELSPEVAVLDLDSLGQDMVSSISMARLLGIKTRFVGLASADCDNTRLLSQLDRLLWKDAPLQELTTALYEVVVGQMEAAAVWPRSSPQSGHQDSAQPSPRQNLAQPSTLQSQSPEESDSLLSLYIEDMERSRSELEERVRLIEFWLQDVEINGRALTQRDVAPMPTRVGGEGGSGRSYTLSVDAFFNAQHRVTVGGVEGPLHSHSWRVNVKLRQEALGEDHFLLGFAEAKGLLRGETSWFDGKILNDLPQFSAIPPTTENVAATLYKNIKAALRERPIEIDSVTLWETPTNSVVYSEN